MSQLRLRYLTHWLLSARGRQHLQVVEYDDVRRKIVKVEPFERECESTIFVNGSLAVVRYDMPDDTSDITPYLAAISDYPVKLVKF